MACIYGKAAHKEMDRGVDRNAFAGDIQPHILAADLCHLGKAGIDELFAKDGVELEKYKVYFRCEQGDTSMRKD